MKKTKISIANNINGMMLMLGIGVFILINLAIVNAVSSSSVSFSSSSSNPQYYSSSAGYSGYSSQYGGSSFDYSQASTFWPSLGNENCQASTDFLMTIPPGGCTPRVVRSDLLEDQNVPIFCRVNIIKINPLIDISNIKSVSYKRNSGATGEKDYVSGVSFYPNKAAINAQRGFINNPFINDAGYVVIVIKRIASERDMPESIKLNLSGVISYDVSGMLGTGKNSYYLEPLSDSDWQAGDVYAENSFFKGKAYLRTEWIEGNRAQVSVYRDKTERIGTFNLAVGETSPVVYIPGFYCKAGVYVRLDGLQSDVDKVKLEVDDDEYWLSENDKFLDGECRVLKINSAANEKGSIVSWKDSTEELTFRNILEKQIETPFKLVYDHNEVEKSITINSVGRYATTNKYSGKEVNGAAKILSVVGEEIKLSDKSGGSPYMSGTEDEKVNLGEITLLESGIFKYFTLKKIQLPVYSTEGKKSVKIWCNGKTYELYYDATNYTIPANTGNMGTKDIISSEVSDASIPADIRDNFEKARDNAEGIADYYGDVGENNEIYSAKAIYQLAGLANKIGLTQTAYSLYGKILNNYKDTPYYNGAELKVKNVNLKYTVYKEHNIRLVSIKNPLREDASADFTVKKLGTLETKNEVKRKINEDFGYGKFKITRLEQNRVDLIYYDTSASGNKQTSFSLTLDDRVKSFSDYSITLDNINLKQVAKVSLISYNPNSASQANFGVEIGIEKRAIKLSPEKLKERIKNLNETIAQWEKITKNLGNVVSVMKGACFATSTVLMVKNFMSNLGGGANARQEVMKQYYSKCTQEVGNDRTAFNNCIKGYESQIENDINVYTASIDKVNKNLMDTQNANLNSAGDTVNRKATTAAYLQQNFNSDVQTTVYLPGENGEIVQSDVTIPREKLASASLTDLRDLRLNMDILNSGASETLKMAASNNIKTIANRIEQKTSVTGKGLYLKDSLDWVGGVRVSYYNNGKEKQMASIVPIPFIYSINSAGSSGKVTGFYALVDSAKIGQSGGYTDAGQLTQFWIQNIGADGTLSEQEDEKVLINLNIYKQNSLGIFGLNREQSDKLVRDAEQAIYNANKNYGKDSFSYGGRNILVNKATGNSSNEPRCQDFMSPSDCLILFNVCDPVMCPSSRCDLGGSYRVDNVAATGIIGSIALCLPNLNEGIVIPVCLTGIHAGLESYLSILKSTRDCLQEQLNTGRVSGICDEIESIYLCEFFWRQMGPFLEMLIPKMIQMAYGQGAKGGGEYLTVQKSWDNMQASVDYFKNDYAVNSMRAFNLRSSEDIGSEFCKMFVSSSVPNGKKFFDNLLQPDSPIQYAAWFDEIPYTEATAVATSQYKVFFHIYAGKDEGVSYQVYLKNPPANAGMGAPSMVVVQTGFIPRGGYASETRDMTAPAGFKEVCIRINGQDNCGFKKVTTEFAMNYISDKYYQEQLENTDVKTKDECISGTPSAMGMLQTGNIQEGVQNSLTPNIDKKGVVRVCASTNPGQNTEPQRWKEVGYCDDETVKCWLDQKSVQDVVKNTGIEQEILNSPDMYGIINNLTVDPEKIRSIIASSQTKIELLKELIVKKSGDAAALRAFISNVLATEKAGGTQDGISISQLITDLTFVEDSSTTNLYKAKARYFKFIIYFEITNALDDARKLEQQSGVSSTLTAPPVSSESGQHIIGGKECGGEDTFYNEAGPLLNDGTIIRDNLGKYWVRTSEMWSESYDEGKTSIDTRLEFSNIANPVCYIQPTESVSPSSSSSTSTAGTTIVTDDVLQTGIVIRVFLSGGIQKGTYQYINKAWITSDSKVVSRTAGYVNGVKLIIVDAISKKATEIKVGASSVSLSGKNQADLENAVFSLLGAK